MSALDEALSIVAERFAAPLTDGEFEAAHRCLIDALGCALAGAVHPLTQSVFSAIDPDEQGVGIIGLGSRYRPADAMLVGATAIRCLDFNDYYSARNNYHPSEHVVPAVLAIAQEHKWSGRDVVDAIARGYRVSLGFGELWPGMLDRGWAPSATVGQISSAALIGLLEGESESVCLNAMSIASLTAPTLGVAFKGQMSGAKSIVNGLAGRAAWHAVEMARAGVTGPGDALDGPGGFAAQVGSSLDRPEGYANAEDISFKPYPTVFLTHAAIAAAIEVSARVRADIDRVREITVCAPEKVVSVAAGSARWAAKTTHEAQFSLPLTVSAALAYGACGLAELADDRLRSSELKRFLSLMKIEVDRKWSGYEGGRVVATLEDGTTLDAEVNGVPGTPGFFSNEQLLVKFRSLVRDALDDTEACRIEDFLMALPNAESIDGLFAADGARG